MGRALLRKPKILVMDEGADNRLNWPPTCFLRLTSVTDSACFSVVVAATASVDARTDRMLQEMIVEQFPNSTVIAIAHRLNTILGADRVVVLEQGRLAVRSQSRPQQRRSPR